MVELLSPAGTLKNMRYAFAYGADAVYAGMPRYSLRVRNNDFNLENLDIGIKEAHAKNKLFYLTTNILPHHAKVKTFVKDMTPIMELQPDALIMADPGLIMLVQKHWPNTQIHLSVQANTMNYAAVQFWQTLGIQRIILSRELSLEDIEQIRHHCPNMELEVFVHGALCIAYSGRCLLSGYFNHRDANQGTCTNACRWEYNVKSETILDTTKTNNQQSCCSSATSIPPVQEQAIEKNYYIEEQKRPGQYMPIIEDEQGTYIMNSKDLRAIEHVQRLIDIGIDCLKIEGRTKSHYYVARTAQAYRYAIDDALNHKEFNPKLLGVLENLANRGYTDGFYQRHHSHEYQNYLDGNSRAHQQQFVGEIIDYNPSKQQVQIEVKNRFGIGDHLELILPSGNHEIQLDTLLDNNGKAIELAPGSGHQVWLPCPVDNPELGLLARYVQS